MQPRSGFGDGHVTEEVRDDQVRGLLEEGSELWRVHELPQSVNSSALFIYCYQIRTQYTITIMMIDDDWWW